MASVQPVCGPFPAAEGPALTRTWNWVVGAIGVVSAIISAYTFLTKGAETVQVLYELATLGGVTLGVGLAAIGGALLGAAIGLGIVLSKGLDRLKARPGRNRCYGGIVTGIATAFRSGEDWAFPYAAQHDRVDVVVKRVYWPLINAAPAVYAWCATDRHTSALIRSYFFSNRVKSAVQGSIAGAVVGAVGGAIAGYFAGVAVAAAIGSAACSASLWFYLLCLLLVIVVALVVALILTLITATAGGAIGAGATGSGGTPTAAPPSGGSAAPVPIALGQYITLNAVLTIYGEDNDAWVGWWVDVTTSPPVLHGVSTAGEGPGGGAPFNFVDADGGFTDACPLPPSSGG